MESVTGATATLGRVQRGRFISGGLHPAPGGGGGVYPESNGQAVKARGGRRRGAQTPFEEQTKGAERKEDGILSTRR